MKLHLPKIKVPKLSKVVSKVTKAVDKATVKVARTVTKPLPKRLRASVYQATVGVEQAATGVVRNQAEGLGKIGDGIKHRDFGKVREGLKDELWHTQVDSFSALGSSALSATQSLLGTEPAGRQLTGAEIANLRQVFGNSIDYAAVTIKEGKFGKVKFPEGAQAVTFSGNLIYVRPGVQLTPDLLAHEMTHIWQLQNGGTDMGREATDARKHGQAGHGMGAGYDFIAAADAGRSWAQLNPEQQAELVQKIVQRNAGTVDTVAGTWLDQHPQYVAAAMAELRAGRGAQ